VVREAKALVPSAWDWAHCYPNASPRLAELATATTRAPDPYLTVTDGFMVRRLAPDSRKAELAEHPGDQLQDRALEDKQLQDKARQNELLTAMGREIGSLHAATADVPAVLEHLKGRDADWLHAASKKAAQAVEDDFGAWASVTVGGAAPGRTAPSPDVGSP
jgi:Ser/Thr protein kinase RdoA (MazF antagonist)